MGDAMVCAEEAELLQRLAQYRSGVCISSLSHREKMIAVLLQESGLVQFDLALCITEAGRKALGVH